MLILSLFVAVGPVLGDFDRDGLVDRAFLRPAGAVHELVVEHGAGTVSVLERVDDPAAFYFGTLPAGTYRTACAKGSGPTRHCERPTVTTGGDTLEFGTREASQAAAIWTGDRFEVHWLSD